MGMVRPHLYVPLVDEAGDLYEFALIRIYREDGVTPYTGVLYRDALTTAVYTNPFTISPAVLDVYVDEPLRVVIGITTDQTKPEFLTEILDVGVDGGDAVLAPAQLLIEGLPPLFGVLSATDPATGFWHPIRIDHQHATVAPDSVLAGSVPLPQAQVGSFPQTTALGAAAGALSVPGSLISSTMLGYGASTGGPRSVAIGPGALTIELGVAPWTGSAVALGKGSVAGASTVAAGSGARAIKSGAVALGAATTPGANALALGAGANASDNGIAIGTGTGSSSPGSPGSIGLGAGAQYGLPSDTNGTYFSVMLGAHDPSVTPTFSWANPLGSQSESWLDEYLPTMAFTGKTIQIQRGLQWLINSLALQVNGDVTVGGRGGTLGFYGKTPVAKGSVGDDEAASGISALDSLIYALRDLGLLNYRTEALMIYRANDLRTGYLEDDDIPAWPEHRGRDVAFSVPTGDFPEFNQIDGTYNDAATAYFRNGYYCSRAMPVQQFRGSNMLGQAKHFVAVARHEGNMFGLNEGLFNLSNVDGKPDPTTVVLSASGVGARTWDLSNVATYELDGLNQTPNRRSWIDIQDPHVYRVTAKTLWPHSRPVIGGPVDLRSYADSWSGSIAEVIGMDATWDEAHANAMSTGLMFLYGINQDEDDFVEPADDFLVNQHDPFREVLVYWRHDDDFVDWWERGQRVYGYVRNAPNSVISVPYVKVYESFQAFEYEGCCSGYWANIDNPEDYELLFVVREISFDDDDDVDIVIGVYELNNNGTWSTGKDWCRRGYKRVIIRHKTTKIAVAVSGTLALAYQDLQVRVYSGSGNNLLLEDTVPLQGDASFSARVRHVGPIVARVYEVSSDTMIGTTERQYATLPRTTIYADDDIDVNAANVDRAYTYESALTALAFCETSYQRYYRARRILSTLAMVANNDGSLASWYSSARPGISPAVPIGLRGNIWTIMAALRYQQVTGDTEFQSFAVSLGNYLLTRVQGSGSLLDVSTGLMSTADNAVAYFALRDLGALTGTSSYTTAAAGIKASLLANHWVTSPVPRFLRSINDDSEDIYADIWGGLFLIAIGNWSRARDVMRHIRRFRVKNQTISAPHYSGASRLVGYKPFAELGANAYVSPPTVIDQKASWAALLFKSRYGEPIGTDVASLANWQGTTISDDPNDVLGYSQFLAYNATFETGYRLRARPYLGVGAMMVLLSSGANYLMLPDPIALPSPVGLAMTGAHDYAKNRAVFTYTWTVDPATQPTAYQAIPEYSINGGTTWLPVSGPVINAQIVDAVNPNVTNGFLDSWSIRNPSSGSPIYRIRVRLRNVSFGGWVASNSVPLPVVH